MDSFQISCVIKNNEGVITRIGINGKEYLIDSAVKWLQNKECALYTIKNGKRAEVYARQHHLTKQWFLITTSDNALENNLDFLPDC